MKEFGPGGVLGINRPTSLVEFEGTWRVNAVSENRKTTEKQIALDRFFIDLLAFNLWYKRLAASSKAGS